MPSTAPPLKKQVLNTIVRAGAGAGKTTELVRRAFEFATKFKSENGVFPRLVICTYTRKATQELRERMMAKACEIGDWALLKYFSSSQVHISTIHGILSLFLGRYGFRIGLDPRYKIIDDSRAFQVAKDLVRNIYSKDTFSEEEKSLLLKNLGVNKMAEISLRYYEAVLSSPEFKPHDANSLRQTLKEFEAQLLADLERLKSEWQELSVPTENRVTVNGVLESIMALNAVVQNQGLLEGREFLLEVLNNSPRLSFGKNKELFLEVIESIKDFKEGLKKLLEKPAFDKSQIESSAQIFSLCEIFFKEFVASYKEKKISLGQIQINDLELFSLECIRSHPETAQLFSTEWDYWLIDEYQDTSPIQVELLNHLVGKNPHFVVGDPQQSIYLFRGARAEVFAAKEKSIEANGGERLVLSKNYRSQKNLVHFFNKLFHKGDAAFTKLEPMREGVLGSEPDVSVSLPSKGQEYLALTHHVKILLSRGVPPEEICILARDNKTLKLAAKNLSRANVPSLLHSASGFYERREILDALAFLKFILNPYDDVNLVQLLRSPWFYLDDNIIVSVLRPKGSDKKGTKDANSAWEKLVQAPVSREESPILKLGEILTRRDTLALSSLFRRCLLDLGFFDFAQKQDITGRREANLWKFILNLERESREPGFNFIDFVTQSEREIDLESAMEQDAVSAREVTRVNLMTVHQSKGLEFSHVILLDIHREPNLTKWLPMSFDEDLKRFSLSLINAETNERDSSLGCLRWVKRLAVREKEEFRRLLYVALTRAEKNLILIGHPVFEKESWGSQIPWDLTVGEHEMQGFKYRVENGPWANEQLAASIDIPVKVREKYNTEDKLINSVVSVSEIVKKDFKANSSLDLSRNYILNRAVSISTGIQVHRMLELLRYSPEGINKIVIQKMFPKRAEDIISCLDYIKKLDTPPMMKILETGFAEWGYLFRDGDKVIEGQIDLWGEVGAEVWIIDYKTGSSEYKETAKHQLQEYARALRAYGVTKSIRLAAVYPMTKEFEVWEG
ncbi:MAG: UvrD-helicase domain-containing protein [Pseudomonadota bacterium]|nr:UvrD-helicase domain-containing protein [Pseudomonadota bacterium]